MAKIANKFGGGAKTNKNGLSFEQTTSLEKALKQCGYNVNNYVISDSTGKKYGLSVQKNKLYSEFLKPNGIDYRDYNSKRWEPDECFINFTNKTAYIIEKKFQNSSGSVDEKLQGCDFKKKEYEKLFKPLGYKVEYLYIFNDWFRDKQYIDVLDYIKAVNCHYFFNMIPLSFLGLDTQKPPKKTVVKVKKKHV